MYHEFFGYIKQVLVIFAGDQFDLSQAGSYLSKGDRIVNFEANRTSAKRNGIDLRDGRVSPRQSDNVAKALLALH